MTIYGYARVSTKGQAKDGNSIEHQIATLKENGAEIVIDESYTGKTTDRPKFNDLIDKLQSGDVLMVTKLDRFARSTIEGMSLMNELLERGVIVKILNFGDVEGGFSSNNKLMFSIFLAFAEFERDMIVSRTQEGKAVAKAKAQAKGEKFKEGRPKKHTKAQLDNALSMLTVNGGKHSYNEVAELLGISKSTLIRENNNRKAEKQRFIDGIKEAKEVQ